MYDLTPNEIKELKTTAYYSGGNFANFPEFFNVLQTDQQLDPAIKKLVFDEYMELQTKKSDFPFIKSIYTNPPYFQETYNKICLTVNSYFSNEISFPELFIVDDLPGHYKNKPWVAMFIDEEDANRAGIEAGIYYKQSSLSHPFFDFIITHELIHWVISHFSEINHPHSNLFEEGVCDFLCYYILTDSSLVDEETLTNFLIYNRSLSEANSLAGMYYRFSKYILNNVYSDGISSLLEAIRKGRGEMNTLHLSENKLFENSKTINSVLRAFNKAEFVVPLPAFAYLMLKEIFNRNFVYFSKSDLLNMDFSADQFEKAFNNLLELNFIINHDEKYYQSIRNFPKNIKFILEDGSAS